MRILLICITLFWSSCRPGAFYEKAFYEKISEIKIPGDFTILESIDNGEFVTATTFRADRDRLQRFAASFGFEPWGDRNSLRLLSNAYLEKDKPDLYNNNNYLYHSGTKGKNAWLYIIDLEKGLLWAEIQYPDAGGT
jgi:hypothetical protein